MEKDDIKHNGIKQKLMSTEGENRRKGIVKKRKTRKRTKRGKEKKEIRGRMKKGLKIQE